MADEFDSTIGKVAAGAAGGTIGLVGGVLASVVTIPAAPFFMFKAIMKTMDQRNAKELEISFGNIVVQMGWVKEYLGNITTALEDIKYRLKYTRQGEKNAIEQYKNGLDGNEKFIKKINKLIHQTDKLVSACDTYFELVRKGLNSIEQIQE